MKRIRTDKNKHPDLILTSDWHLREDQPVCRTDDFWEVQWDKVSEIADLRDAHLCDVLHAGDLFHHWKPSPFLLTTIIKHLWTPEGMRFYTVYGQHDLPQHNIKLGEKSGVRTFVAGCHGACFPLGLHYGETPESTKDYFKGPSLTVNDKKVLLWHKLIWEKKAPHWSDAPTALEILKKYPEYDLIVTGDNHSPFVVEHEGRLLVNPGSITRQTADQEKHKPRVYLWYADTNTVEPVYLPIEKGVISREHIERTEKRNERIEAFISRLDTDWEVDVSFENNLERFLAQNNIKKSVETIIREAIE